MSAGDCGQFACLSEIRPQCRAGRALHYYPEEVELPNTLFNLTDALLGRGYSEEDIGNIWGGNWLRVMDTVWGDPDAQIIDDNEDTPDGVPHLHKH